MPCSGNEIGTCIESSKCRSPSPQKMRICSQRQKSLLRLCWRKLKRRTKTAAGALICFALGLFHLVSSGLLLKMVLCVFHCSHLEEKVKTRTRKYGNKCFSKHTKCLWTERGVGFLFSLHHIQQHRQRFLRRHSVFAAVCSSNETWVE